jgi:hypothetical protein
MTYQDLIQELQDYSPEQLQQHVKFMYCGDSEDGDKCSAEDVSFLTCTEGNQIYIIS